MTLPKENLDDKNFEELVKEAVSRIPVYALEWTDHNIHDPGITFIELFAWLAEMQIYRLNMISDESYRKFLTLVGIHDHTGAASGGEETEKLEEAIIRARKDMKTVYRAVTSADYELLAMNTPGLRVARAKAIPRYHPRQGDSEVPGIVTVIVVPHSQEDKSKPSVPSVGFLKTVYTHLDKHRLLTTELFVISPEYIEVSVDATVVIKPKYVENKVEERVRQKLTNFLHHIGGGVDQKGWPFGRSVYISEIYEIIDRVEGVDYVKTVTLKKNGEKQEGDIKISAHDLVCSVTHEIIVIVFLFSIDEQLISEWDNNTISKGLREAFKTKKGIAISENASIVKVGDNKWKIIDGKVVYIITKENKKLNIYKGEIHE